MSVPPKFWTLDVKSKIEHASLALKSVVATLTFWYILVLFIKHIGKMSDAEGTPGRHDEHDEHSGRIPVFRGSGRGRNQKKKKVDVATLAKRAKKKNDDNMSDTMAAELAEEEDHGQKLSAQSHCLEDKVPAESTDEDDSERKVAAKPAPGQVPKSRRQRKNAKQRLKKLEQEAQKKQKKRDNEKPAEKNERLKVDRTAKQQKRKQESPEENAERLRRTERSIKQDDGKLQSKNVRNKSATTWKGWK